MNLTKGTLQLTILLGVVILILVGIVGYLVWKVQKHPTPPTPPTPPQTSLKLLYPKGEEVWKERETYKIKWEAKGVKKVNIEYGYGKSYFVVQNYSADKGEYEWTPQGIVEQYEGFVMKPLAEVQIKISVWDAENPNLYDKSDDITLISQETADWKVYRNEEYGFEFRYPKNMLLTSESVNEWQLSFPNQNDIYINLLIDKQLSVNLPGTFGGRLPYTSSQKPTYTESYKIGNLLGKIDYWIVYGGAGSWDRTINAYFQKDDLYYILSLYWPFNAYPEGEGKQQQIIDERLNEARQYVGSSNQYLRIFHLILSTFKFID